MAVKVPEKSPPKDETPEELLELPDGFETIDAPITKELPELPSKNINANKDSLFFDWMLKLKPEDWNHCMIYVYREWPVIDRQKVNPTNVKNIDSIGKCFTKEEFMKDHGSGKYKALIIDNNKAHYKGKGTQVGVARFEIDDPDYLPVINLEEVQVDHPSNREYVTKLKALGKLGSDGMPVNVGGNAADTTALTGLVSRLIDKLTSQPQATKDTSSEAMSKMFLDANGTIMSMMKDQIKSDDPEKLVKMLAILKDLFPKEGSNNTLLELIVKMQSEMAKVQAEASKSREELILKMMEMNKAPQDGEDKFLSRLVAYKELFSELGGGNGGGKKSTLETVMEYGAPVAEKLLGTIGNLIQFATVRKASGATTPVEVRPEQLLDKPPQTSPEPQQPQAEQPPANNVVEMPHQPTLKELIAGPVGPMIIDALKAGKTGDAFADSVATMFNDLAYQQIAGLGKEAILAEMQAVPAFWNQVVPSAVEKFVDDFIAYGTQELSEGEE